jgi:hypothetical protein
MYLLMALVGSCVIACEQENGKLMLDPRRNIDKPVRAIADSDPLHKCVEGAELDRNGATSSICDPKDGVVLPDADPEETLDNLPTPSKTN